MRVFRGFVLGLVFVMVFGCLSGCVYSLDSDEQEQWDKCSQAFKRVSPLLLRAARDKKVKERFKDENYVVFSIKRDGGKKISGFSDFPFELSEQNLKDLRIIDRYFHVYENSFEIAEVAEGGRRISYYQDGTPMVVYSPDKIPDYYINPDPNRDRRDFTVYKLEKDWYQLWIPL